MQTLLTGWSAMRWFRLLLAVIITIQAIQMRDPLAGMIAAFFMFQVATNTGCCGAGGCAVPYAPKKESTQDITFEEIKSNESKA